MPHHSLAGRVALVTGATRRRGIGAAVCLSLARAGADIAFTHWRPYDRTMPWDAGDGDPARLESQIRDLGRRCQAVEIDLSPAEAPARLMERIWAGLGPLSILVNNAAHSTVDGLDALDAATLDAHYAVNVRAPILLSLEFARRFNAGSGGRVINFSSGQSLGPMRGEIAYAATKGAIEAFTRTFAAEVAGRGITVNAINPGPTDTGWMTHEQGAELRQRFPAGRLGQPDDAARLVTFLAGDDAEWITGQVIHSEGGFIRE